jgi:hypothetical protein
MVRDSTQLYNWDAEQYQKSINYFKQNCKGGRIIIYVERFDYYFTNMKFFLITLRDSTDKNKIYEYEFPYRAADFVTTERYSNYGFVNLSMNPGNTFYVYINQKESAHLSDYKFLIEKYKTK